jgi:hypothetical protein
MDPSDPRWALLGQGLGYPNNANANVFSIGMFMLNQGFSQPPINDDSNILAQLTSETDSVIITNK